MLESGRTDSVPALSSMRTEGHRHDFLLSQVIQMSKLVVTYGWLVIGSRPYQSYVSIA